MKFLRNLLLSLGLATLCGCNNEPAGSNQLPPVLSNPSQTFNTTQALASKYTLRQTDILLVEMYGEQDFKSNVSIDQDGKISLPLIGSVSVGGKTVAEAQALLTEKYKEYFKEPSLSLYIFKYAERKVYVDGMVGRPGAVPFPNEENMTLARAIAAASGILPRGERSDVTLTRTVNGKTTTIHIDMDELSSGRKPDIELQENDLIYVRDSRI